jgi:arylsulfatase A-like enzyme/tetratricopeptide (TPR) repeat protein
MSRRPRQRHDGRARRTANSAPANVAGERTSAPASRPFRLAIGLVLVGLVAAGVWWWRRAPTFAIEPRTDRNVLLVTIDTLRGDVLSCYGGAAETPHLDALAAHGARFTFAHAHSVLTLPSHASILTGEYPYDHGLRDNAGYRLSPDTQTMATRLKRVGFSTGAFVGAFPLERRFGLNVGFDVYDDRVGQGGPSGVFSEPERRADAVVKVAIEWIDRQTGRWFAWVHVYDPHAPYAPPAEWQARYGANPYAGEVAWTDSALGPLFDRLGAQPRSTLVVVTGDHGESLGSHGELTHGVFAYEPTLRVPLIISDVEPRQRKAPAGVTIDSSVRHIDVLPTVLSAVGVPADGSLPGSSLAGLISGQRDADRSVYFEAMMTNLERGWAPLRGVIVGREKYIDLPIPELYDLSEDPGETRNLAAARGDRLQVLQKVLRGYNTAPPGTPMEETAAVRDRLRSLGYIGMSAAPVPERYTEKDDPKWLIDLDKRMQTAIQDGTAGKVDAAVDTLRSVIAEQAHNAEAYLNLALVWWQAGRTSEAIATLETALKRGITRREIRVKLGLCLALTGEGRRAIPFLEGLTADDPEAVNALGLAYAQAGRPTDAIRMFRHVLDLDPANGLADENIGLIQLDAKDYGAAETSLRRALSLDPTLGGAQAALGDALAATGRQAAAIGAWTAALALDAEQHNALYKLTVTLAAAGRLDEARPYGERFLRIASPGMEGPQIAAVRRALQR